MRGELHEISRTIEPNGDQQVELTVDVFYSIKAVEFQQKSQAQCLTNNFFIILLFLYYNENLWLNHDDTIIIMLSVICIRAIMFGM